MVVKIAPSAMALPIAQRQATCTLVAVSGLSTGTGVVVLEHQVDDPAGFIGEWLDARAIAWSVVRPDDPEPDPATPAAIISLGSGHSAYAPEPAWIARECSLLRAALAAGTPVLGVCFGAQTLALAGGGEVARAARPEVGWVQAESDQRELSGSWLSWHFDTITIPPDAVELARSPEALQAFRLGRSLAIQFHPEVTPAIWAGWTESEPDVAERHVGDPDRFVASLEARAGDLRARVFALLDWWHRALATA
jgi:GMP synthase (glutamine-hydrolysing)